MRNLLFLCILTFGITSCSEGFFDQTIDIDPPAYEKQLVLHTLASNRDSVFRVPLTRNFGILDQTVDSSWAVKNALVQVYEDGNLKRTLQPEGEQWYATPLTPGFFQPGKNYELRVSHPDYPAVTARQVMPGPFQIDSAAYRENAGIASDGSKLSAFDVYLKDQAGVKNYYVITVDGVSPELYPIFDDLGNLLGYDTTGFYINSIYPETAEDPNVRPASGRAFAVSDQFFDGQAYKLSFRTYYLYGGNESYRIHVWSVTEDYFLYLVSAQRKYDAGDLPLTEPVTVHHNVAAGIGIFGLGWEEVRDVQ